MTELEEVKAELAKYKAMYDDEVNENVHVIKGWYEAYGHGEYGVVSVGNRYLSEALDDLRYCAPQTTQVTLSWHVTDEPKSYIDLECNIAKAALGDLKTTFSHAYSDLTGYLWTTEQVQINGHDILAEIQSAVKALGKRAWVYVRFEVHV